MLLPGEVNQSLIPTNKAMMSYPSRKPLQKEKEEEIAESVHNLINKYLNKKSVSPVTRDIHQQYQSRSELSDESEFPLERRMSGMEADFNLSEEYGEPLIESQKKDDDDQDKGGQRIKQNPKYILMKKQSSKEDEEEKSLLNKPYDDDDDDNDNNERFGTPKGKRILSYEQEIERLVNEKEQLFNELEKNKVELPLLEIMNQKLQNKMKSLEKEIEYLKHIEDSAIRDYNDLKLEYDKQVEEINSMDLTNKELKNRSDANKTHFDQEIERYAQAYESSKAESAKEIEYIKGEYENKLKKMKLEYNDLKQLTNEKDNEIRNLYQSMEQGNTNANQLDNELNSYKRKYYDLEIKRNQDTVSEKS